MIASAAIPAIPPIPLTRAPTFCAVAREGVSTTAPATNITKQADGRFHLWERQALDLSIEISVDVYPGCGLQGCIAPVLERFDGPSDTFIALSLLCLCGSCYWLPNSCSCQPSASGASREAPCARPRRAQGSRPRRPDHRTGVDRRGSGRGLLVPLHIDSQGWLALASRFTSRANELKVDDPGPHAPHPNANSAPRSSRGVLPVQRLQAWLKELGSSKPKSQAILEIGMVSSSR